MGGALIEPDVREIAYEWRRHRNRAAHRGMVVYDLLCLSRWQSPCCRASRSLDRRVASSGQVSAARVNSRRREVRPIMMLNVWMRIMPGSAA